MEYLCGGFDPHNIPVPDYRIELFADLERSRNVFLERSIGRCFDQCRVSMRGQETISADHLPSMVNPLKA